MSKNIVWIMRFFDINNSNICLKDVIFSTTANINDDIAASLGIKKAKRKGLNMDNVGDMCIIPISLKEKSVDTFVKCFLSDDEIDILINWMDSISPIMDTYDMDFSDLKQFFQECHLKHLNYYYDLFIKYAAI